MGPLSAWAIRKPITALIVWALAIVGVGALAFALDGKFNDSFSLPSTQSALAQNFLEEVSAQDANSNSATVVWSPTSGTVDDETVKGQIDALLTKVAAVQGVTCITSPYGKDYGTSCPKKESSAPDFPPGTPPEFAKQVKDAFANGTTDVTFPDGTPEAAQKQLLDLLKANKAAKEATSTISKDGTVAYATVTFTGAGPAVANAAQADAFVSAVEAANTPTLQVGATGQILTAAQGGPGSSEGIGILAAIVILIILFGSLVAAGLPIVVAVVGLLVGQLLILVIARFLDVASFAPQLASMIGLGVGIDYSLFILNRFRQETLAGRDPKEAIGIAVRTAGRAVLFAGSTVIIALLGLFVLGVSFFNGLAVAAAATVFVVMLAALILLPAVASLLGKHTLGLRMPWARHPKMKPLDESRWAGYGALLQKAPWLTGLLALGLVVLLLAVPAFSIRQGFPDNGSAAPGSTARVGYDLMSKGFGPGVNGPFFVAVTLPLPLDDTALTKTVEALAATEGVASTIPNKDMLPLYTTATIGGKNSPFSESGIVTSVLVQPTTAPDDPATNELLTRLRTVTSEQVAPTGAAIYVGGTQAVTQDFTNVLISVLPLFLLVVIGLGFIALFLLFRSLLIPLTAAVTSLLSFAAALGVTVAVFQWGWGASLIGVATTGPILPFLPIMVFAILFGLSMDYEVFLVSRMQEGWHETGDNREAVRHGLAGSGKVVVAAALIMSSVFLAFVPMPNDTIKLFDVALASAVIIDAFIVRLVLVPSVMSMFGRANWWLPGWLSRRLPNFSVE